jgi:hypothetical protein
MTVETTLQDMFDNYPKLFATRQECFNHLFMTVGCGYDWMFGQLVISGQYNKEIHDEDYLNPKAVKAEQSIKNIKMKNKIDKELYEFNRMEALEEDGIDIGPYDPNKRHWSEISTSSNILNIPDDIKPDWKAAVEECMAMLKADNVCLEPIY